MCVPFQSKKTDQKSHFQLNHLLAMETHQSIAPRHYGTEEDIVLRLREILFLPPYYPWRTLSERDVANRVAGRFVISSFWERGTFGLVNMQSVSICGRRVRLQGQPMEMSQRLSQRS